MRKIIPATFLVILFFASCKTTKVDTKNPDNNGKLLISMQRTACFGKCPIYQISIFENGFLYYEAVKFTGNDGKFCNVLSKKDMDSLHGFIGAAHLLEMSDKYPEAGGPPADLPSCIITYQSKDKKKKIVDYGIRHPDSLVKLERQMDEILKKQKLQSCDK